MIAGHGVATALPHLLPAHQLARIAGGQASKGRTSPWWQAGEVQSHLVRFGRTQLGEDGQRLPPATGGGPGLPARAASPLARRRRIRSRLADLPVENWQGHRSDGAGPNPVPEPAQLTADAAVAPARVVPGQPQHQIADLCRHAWTTTPVWVGPTAPDQVAVPSQQRVRLHQQPAPDIAGQHPRQPSQHRPVGPVLSGSGHMPAEHRSLVPQHQQLRFLGR
jgi:hypothetical protein